MKGRKGKRKVKEGDLVIAKKTRGWEGRKMHGEGEGKKGRGERY